MPSLVVHVAFVSLVVFSFFAQVDGVLYGTSDDDLRRLFPEYEIVQPFVVSYGGEFISHDLKNVERNTHKHYLRRRKRSMQDLETIEVDLSYRNVIASNRSIDVRNDMFYDNNTDVLDEPNMENNPLDKYAVFQQRIITPPFPRKYFHFNVSAFGSRLQLKVESKTRLLAPGAKSVLFTADGKRIEKDLNSGCLLFGNVPQDSHSRVAISNCNGLAGLIQTENEEFFIEPIEEQEDVHVPQRHVIYRRSVVRSESIGKRMDRERTKRDLGPNESVESLGNSVQKVLSENQDRIHKHKRHTKRSEYNIEILLTADSEVVNFHGRNHVENYLLTLVNIVDEIYHDSSLGEHINIVLSRLYQLDEERLGFCSGNRRRCRFYIISTSGYVGTMYKRQLLLVGSLIIDDNASTSLKNVCKWAHAMHQTDPAPHGRSPDHAIFLTRRRFGPAGYAHVSGMCHPLRSCSLNHEDGFSSSFVVAHETGHVLGMEHDGEGNKCGDETSMGSIMAPLVQAAFHRYHWSRCSQQELKRNLRKFTCLRDDPHSPDWGPTPAYPGVTYSMDDQCRFDFGQGYRRCTAFRNLDVCKTLWCSHDDNPLFCKTKKGPPVDGTECGENMWCFKSHCVWRDQRQAPINGNWSAWSPYSECSRSCGTGVMYRSRMCDNPPPSHGGSECVGKNVDYDLCNKRSCSARTDFRADQCSYRNDLVEYKGQRHKWLPYEPLDADLKCDLFCVSKKTNDVVTMGDIVADGTLCSYDDPHSICIRGECVEIGCDKMMGSARREDDCGVCGGDGRQCRNIHGEVKKRVNRKLNNYIKLYKIPAGARHIRIQEASPVDNTNLLALKSRADKRYFLNAKARRIPESETPRKIIHSGSMWSYDSQQGKETITCRGPINSDVILLLLIQRRNVKAIVRYSYVAHVNDVPKPRDTYRYEIRRWSPCSGRCGSGHKRAKYGCRSQTGNKWVSKRNCKGKPPRSTRQPCRVECRTISRWETGDWGPCSKTCGSEGFQRRDVTCHQVNHQGVSKVTDDSSCQSNQRPIARKICYPHPCPPRWRKGAWSDCSASCGPGTQRRQVICRTLGIPRAFNPSACTDARPIDVQSCESVPCIAEVAVALSTTTTGTTTTNPATTIADNCVRDQSIFCSVDNLGQYCAIGSYRKLCCKSCRKVLSKQSKQDSATGRSVHNKPPNIAIQSAIANITANSDQDLDKETIFTNQAGPPITPSADDNVIINPPINVTTGDISETPDQDGSMSDDDVIVEVVDDMTDVAASDAENVGYYDESMNNEYMDGGDDLQEFILTLPPPSDAEEPTSVADHHVMLANKRKGSATVPGPTDDSVPSRRKRSVNDFSLVLKDWSECYVKECGAGIRHSIYGCWNNVNQAWTEMEHCPEATTLTTACFMPCYSVSGNSSDRRIEFQSIPSKAVCREFKRDGLGPRTSSIKCRGLRYRKTYSQFSSVQRHHFTTRTSSRKMRASLREKRERNVDGS